MAFDERLSDTSTEVDADFFLPYVQPHASLLHVGCGDGALSIGLAAHAKSVVGVDHVADFAAAEVYAAVHGISNLQLLPGDVVNLPFEDETFDVCFCSSVLERMPDPLKVLSEVWRVLRPGGWVGVASVDYGGLLLAGPDVDLLDASNVVRQRLWQQGGCDPFVGRELRRLLGESHFSEVEATTRALSYGTSARVRAFAAARAAECWDPRFSASVVEAGWATETEMVDVAQAWAAWGESPAAYAAFTWCRAIGRKPTGRVEPGLGNIVPARRTSL
jgi:SAM-dependent methyltransferase